MHAIVKASKPLVSYVLHGFTPHRDAVVADLPKYGGNTISADEIIADFTMHMQRLDLVAECGVLFWL